MKTATIQLKIKNQAKTTNTCKAIKNAFIQSCLNLDASIFEPYIAEDRYFQELDKYRFLQSLKDIFSSHSNGEVKKISLKHGKCQFCYLGMATHDFYDESGYHLFSYIISEENGLLDDISICNMGAASSLENFTKLVSLSNDSTERTADELERSLDEWINNAVKRKRNFNNNTKIVS